MSGIASPALPACLEGVPLLRDRPPAAGERWIYSAAFNVEPDLAETARIDCELGDLARLAEAGARVVVLADQGSERAGTAQPLDFAAAHLEARLGRPVAYLPDPLAAETHERLAALGDGSVAVVGNTRMLAGEESNDPELARRLAALGDLVALGGFAKSHRLHASNAGLLAHRPGWVAESVVAELTELAPWAQAAESRFSVAALGGRKREKLDPGLLGLADRYDLVIPGGTVLNALLAARGHAVGASDLGEEGGAATAVTALLARGCRAAVHLPERVVVAPATDLRPDAARTVPLADGVPADYAIVDFELHPRAATQLRRLRAGDRVLLAGPPGLADAGFRGSAHALLAAMATPGVEGLLLGGDTVRELPWPGPTTTGGGSALRFLAEGRCPVLEVLAARRHR